MKVDILYLQYKMIGGDNMWQFLCGIAVGFGVGKVITTLIFVIKERE
jgi:hypothetical protein